MNLTDSAGETALGSALLHNQLPIAEELIKAGANVDHMNQEGKSLLHVAILNSYNHIADFLLHHNANPNTR